ncbi:MAG TPA: hypothetical protein PKA74_01380 [Bauldia sp.]|nr:hypothetical protein [Bauldia sp.]
MRAPVMIIAGLIATGPAAAEDVPGRFALQPGDDGGFVRLDTRTGAVSHCGETDGTWRCEPFAEETDALEARLAGMEAEIAALRAALDTLRQQLVRPPEPPAVTAAPPPPPPPPGLSERLMGSLFGLVRALKGAP